MALALMSLSLNTTPSQKTQYVTAIELQRALSKRRHRDIVGHTVVLSSCYGKIKRVAGIDGTSCIFEVPEFVMGVPPYDLSKAVTHVIASLERNGYEVAYMFPRALLISWDLENINLTPLNQSHMNPLPLPLPLPMPVPFPPASPLPPIARARAHTHMQPAVGFRPISDFKPTSRFVLH